MTSPTAMRLILVSMVLVTIALLHLVVDPSPLVQWLGPATAEHHTSRITQETYDDWVAGSAEGDTFSMHQLGLTHVLVSPDQLPDGVEQDSTIGAGLLIRSMAAGFGGSGTMWYGFMGHTSENLQMAAASGSAYAIELLATDLALEHCDTGIIDPAFSETFLDEYEPRMRPDRQLEFYPDSMRDRVAEPLVRKYDRVIAGIRKIPERFTDLCEIKPQWASIGGPSG